MRTPRGNLNTTLSQDFLDFISCLIEQRVDFVLVGGYAVGVRGVVRATGDIDFLYRRNQSTVDKLCAAMIAFGAPQEVIDRDALLTPNTVTQFGQPPNRIDLLTSLDGVTFTEVWSGSSEEVMNGRKLRVIGMTELRANKAATGRKKDMQDLEKLDALKQPKRKR